MLLIVYFIILQRLKFYNLKHNEYMLNICFNVKSSSLFKNQTGYSFRDGGSNKYPTRLTITQVFSGH